ncbi:Oligopeptide transport ATP-binding protein appF [Vibrio nigripulchritudo SFn27]|uniref:Oligopeptide transport ATP-binding protein appF n=1 Tax=Vibrio nigripulchritudo TaxID=28173 RepID=U4KA71_9VIBR|nr:oligopeptide/dipeptide ABC transporter ATP-binding protein [Vibrio nigripulchritudo]CCN83815.1 Oligopeptide transport ATP-binding protein appF [Vibrio nigripulchritudo BLFn1]CCN87177.1 Oligopeptide transport ATP-binding protein appF [Vibrio nigripulchritudo SFn27]CCN94533.1 Oligopeptide transport ATP-binding protein appF [Vibrio nigripulchritudo ENn2]CCO40901.1 Oligopeptide transport ATP-binding protein appF [Vibrio nigripulchritudo SFn135]CCO54980.1 Oligopeptide transport ATP-binding prote
MNKQKPILEVKGLIRDYELPREGIFGNRKIFRALHDINMTVHKGCNFGIVGESGCGKSTLARTILTLETPTQGSIFLRGRDLFALPSKDRKMMRKHLQIIFQDPYSSLNPRKKIEWIVAEPLTQIQPNMTRSERAQSVEQALEAVGLPASAANKYPHEFSGGQRQRIAIARALITRPDVIVADESVSALDVSVQAQVLNLMNDLQKQFGLTYLFISHDMSVVRWVTDDVLVMYLGRVVEQGPTQQVFSHPQHPYTKALLDAVPHPDPSRRGQRRAARNSHPPNKTKEDTPTTGCPYANRCQMASAICRESLPELRVIEHGRKLACHLA